MDFKRYFSQINDYVDANPTKALRIAFWLWCAYEILLGLAHVIRAGKLTYNSIEISDWMINYQGGFVRRGIAGEALYQLYLVHPYSLRLAIFAIMSATFLVLLFLLYRLFKRNGWSYILLPSCVLIVQGFTNYIFWTRKDYILLLGAFIVFWCYRNYIVKRTRALSFIAMQAVAILLMLIHEATLFFTIPILFCDFFSRLHWERKQSIIVSAMKSLLFFFPVIAVWAVVCLYKGDKEIAVAIWQSWEPAMEAFPISGSTDNIGAGVAWLGKSFVEAAPFHLRANFGGWFLGHHIPIIPSLPFTLYSYVAVYYVVTRMQTVDLKFIKLKPIDNVLLSNILLAQFIFMLPMFTVLSTDGARTIPYWIVSSLFFIHFFYKSAAPFPQAVTRISTKMQSWIDSKPWLNNPWVYFAIIVTIPLQQWGHSTIQCYVPVKIAVKALRFIYHNYLPLC